MLDAIKNRRSVRSFLPEQPSPTEVEALLRAALQAPSAMNRRPLHYLSLEGTALAGILAANPNTPKSTPFAIMVCVDDALDGGSGLGDIDAAAAVENILLAAEELGLGAVWTHVFPQAVPRHRELLGLPATVRSFAIVALGKPAQKPAPVDRWDAARVHRNRW